LNTYYGNIHALKGISLHVDRGEIVTLIGANGAGKTTTLHTISGLVQPRSGQVLFDGEDLTQVPAHEIVPRGVIQVPEGRRMFSRLTVEENLRMGGFTLGNKSEIQGGIERAYTMFPRLRERRGQVAGTLSGGEQQMLAMGRALMAKPKVLLLDEPSMGLAPNLVEQIFATIENIHSEGTAILLVEQNAHMALEVADRGYILQTGEIVLADTSENLRDNDEVRRAYLGVT
ncbi:MAG TPA: ABC transporter ATP-binding protein, partial [Candidatus Caenarcaniphilales bacterium]|nr:ABC transporter ATP-binding protein [Candidatus Caenarcaniphilales bacterium]